MEFGGRQDESEIPIDLRECEYEKLCECDPQVKKFDEALMQRTEGVLKSVANNVDEKTISFLSLKDVTSSFLEVDKEVVNVILKCKKDVWASNTLFQLVTEYFENSLATLDFCDELDKCTKKARENQMLVQVAVNLMPGDTQPSKSQCEKILHKLNNFVEAGNPFSEEFLAKFQAVYARQVELQKRLRVQKKRLDRRLKLVKGWIKVSTIILGFSMLPLESEGKWFRSLWTKYEAHAQNQVHIIYDTHSTTFVMIKELDNIRLFLNKLRTEIEFTVHDIKFGSKRGDPFSVKLAMENLSMNQANFMRDFNELEKHVNHCRTTILNARTVVLRRIVKKRSVSF